MAKTGMATTKQYEVLNPRGIPVGRNIIRVGDRRWREGDVVSADDMSTADLRSLIVRGFLREVGDG